MDKVSRLGADLYRLAGYLVYPPHAPARLLGEDEGLGVGRAV